MLILVNRPKAPRPLPQVLLYSTFYPPVPSLSPSPALFSNVFFIYTPRLLSIYLYPHLCLCHSSVIHQSPQRSWLFLTLEFLKNLNFHSHPRSSYISGYIILVSLPISCLTLNLAISNGYLDVVKALLARGASPSLNVMRDQSLTAKDLANHLAPSGGVFAQIAALM